MSFDFDITDAGVRHRLTLTNGVLTQSTAPQPTEADVSLRLSRAALNGLLTGQLAPEGFADAGVDVTGDPGVLGRLMSALDQSDPGFNIVLP